MATHTVRITTSGIARSTWPVLLGQHGYRITSGARRLVTNAASFQVSRSRTADITLIPAGMIPGGSSAPRDVEYYARFMRLKKPRPEDALYLRLLLANGDMEMLSMKRIIVMHDPLHTKGDQRERRLEITATNGGWVGAPVVSDLVSGDVSGIAYAFVLHENSQ